MKKVIINGVLIWVVTEMSNSKCDKILNTSIYVAAHKPFDTPLDEAYKPIEVGSALRECHTGFIRDDTGDNISEKNAGYCELTGLYWLWKNDKESDIVGLCHYRRFFSNKPLSNAPRFFLDANDVTQIMRESDIILPREFYWRNDTVRTIYAKGEGRDKDLIIVRDIIRQRCASFVDSFDAVVNSCHASYCNLFIAPKMLADEYCEWLFDILFALENEVDTSGYSEAELRIFGYISEILLNVWVLQMHCRRFEVPMVRLDTPPLKKIIRYVRDGKRAMP
ncbi:DUF4422 domain-containing protein [Olsenella intestinalis]|uniref:DUF4422 domain-containing protein n=1 Tax=Olsenella intestinalis TaxID=2930083 RepID=UPI00200EDBAE